MTWGGQTEQLAVVQPSGVESMTFSPGHQGAKKRDVFPERKYKEMIDSQRWRWEGPALNLRFPTWTPADKSMFQAAVS